MNASRHWVLSSLLQGSQYLSTAYKTGRDPGQFYLLPYVLILSASLSEAFACALCVMLVDIG